MSDNALDPLETRDPAEREAALMAALPAQVAAALCTPAFAERLHGVEPAAVSSRAALAALPVTRKHELLERQAAERAAGGDPFGGFAAIGWRGIGAVRVARRVFQSPGPIYEPEGAAADYWRFGRALRAAGFTAGDLVHNSFSYHLTPAGSMMEGGALALGCAVFPGGVGNTELQLQALAELRADAYAGTPSFLRILLEKADIAGLRLPALRKAAVSGEAFPPALRDAFRARGIEAYQSYATADLGLVAYETEAREGLVLDESVIVEIVRPGTGEPLPDGEVGEVVVTVLNPDYPLIRFGTGDLSAILPGACPTGRSNARMRGWLGRADQTAKVRGMFVHPAQVAEVLRRHPELGRARLVVEGEMADDRMTLMVECTRRPEGLAASIAQTVRDVTKLRAEVELCDPGQLPNDGKVIDDLRRVG
ncbi:MULTISPECIES: phenylacetate--CoA ligase family protein [unclassified Rubrivivax]|uniref:phenylacetate--CoA ligase family protein n=1 Tax=unclassified Rubrivivax TaxID=2649762 RepID=UPI001E30E7A5|nr:MULTISPECIES: AMP-binding protein [unclassified Rubrivivax]MCC9598549.1 AMP-binding protein [Rubrivivax sp. JA1055]MCC9648250.1 AMP-binding protein [Rubrivivax sp. JA1029]